MGSKNINLALNVLQIALGCFFIFLGVAGIVPQIDEGDFGISFSYTWLEIVFGIFEIGAGVIIILGSFFMRDSRLGFWGGLIAVILWGMRAFLASYRFVRMGKHIFEWLLVLSLFVIVGLALFAVIGKND